MENFLAADITLPTPVLVMPKPLEAKLEAILGILANVTNAMNKETAIPIAEAKVATSDGNTSL